jgi:hypothetical protein
MSFLLPKLTTKQEVDNVIKSTRDLVLVLRFGREDDTACLQLDDIVRLKFNFMLWKFDLNYNEYHYNHDVLNN